MCPTCGVDSWTRGQNPLWNKHRKRPRPVWIRLHAAWTRTLVAFGEVGVHDPPGPVLLVEDQGRAAHELLALIVEVARWLGAGADPFARAAAVAPDYRHVAADLAADVV